jgi:CRISPR-associated protein Cmr2
MKYLALTIGPIYGTLKKTRSTKAMWAASYLFSYLMRELLAKIRNTTGATFLTPSVSDDSFFENEQGFGLFHDRFIVEVGTSNLSLDDLKNHMKIVINDIILKVLADCSSKSKTWNNALSLTSAQVREYITDFLQLYAIEVDVEGDNQPVPVIEGYLNSVELEGAFVAEESANILKHFFEEVYYNFLMEDGISNLYKIGDSTENKRGFPCTAEIASIALKNNQFKTIDLQNNFQVKTYDSLVSYCFPPSAKDEKRKMDDLDEQQIFFRKLKEAVGKDTFRLQHKYIAIVQADGDSMGGLFSSLEKSERLEVSTRLMHFAQQSVQTVLAYGATPIFAGGDDLVFFAPLSSKEANGENIFHLLEKIDTHFEDMVLKGFQLSAGIRKPTMSYGVSICHYKYPLGENYAHSGKMLRPKAKSHPNKNAIAWQIIKHSGHRFGCIFNKNEDSFKTFKSLKPQGAEQNDNFLASVIYKLESLESLFEGVTKLENHDWQKLFYNILFNNFNESVHRETKTELSKFLKAVCNLLVACFNENPKKSNESHHDWAKSNLNKAYAALRFIHFLNTEDKE